MLYEIKQLPARLPPGSGSTHAICIIIGYSPDHDRLVLIYPPIQDERLSRPELTQASNLPRVATKVLAIPGVC